jgi:hypothetical protein
MTTWTATRIRQIGPGIEYRRRGSILIVAIVTMLVVTIIVLALMAAGNATFQEGRRQPRVTGMQAIADGGAQYGYWKYVYGGVALPYVEDNHQLGPGTFSITVTNNTATILNTIKVVSTAKLYSDTYAVTKVYSFLGAPTGLVATADSSSIGLTWNPVNGAALYDIYRATVSGAEGAVPYATGISGTSYTDDFVTAGTRYYYEVTALGYNQSAKSAQVNARMAAATNVVAVPNVAFTTNDSSGEEDLYITNTKPITAMVATFTVAQTVGLTYASASNTFPNGYIAQANATAGGNVTYTYTLNVGDTPAAGTYILAALWSLTGTAHPTAGDTYTLRVTSGGVVQNLSGAW